MGLLAALKVFSICQLEEIAILSENDIIPYQYSIFIRNL